MINSRFSIHSSHFRSGQTLVMLLVFMAIGITVTTAAVLMSIINAQSTLKFNQGNLALGVAESGAENGLLRLLRDPNYLGETLTIGSGTATITVVGGTVPVITSVGRAGNYTRKIQVNTTYNNNVLAITSWREVFP